MAYPDPEAPTMPPLIGFVLPHVLQVYSAAGEEFQQSAEAAGVARLSA